MNTKHLSLAKVRGSRRRWVRSSAALAMVVGSASVGCQTFFPGAAPGSFALGEDRRIAKQAAAEKFPSPADVGLKTPTSVP